MGLENNFKTNTTDLFDGHILNTLGCIDFKKCWSWKKKENNSMYNLQFSNSDKQISF